MCVRSIVTTSELRGTCGRGKIVVDAVDRFVHQRSFRLQTFEKAVVELTFDLAVSCPCPEETSGLIAAGDVGSQR